MGIYATKPLIIKKIIHNFNSDMPRKNNVNNGLKEKIEDFFHSDSPQATATKIVLMVLALGAVAFGGAVVPGIFKVIEGLKSESGTTKKIKCTKKQINSAISSLKKRKFIKIIKEKNGRVKVKLTNKGKKRILEISLDFIAIKKPKNWDGKWRIVTFDIPVAQNTARAALRGKMKKLGFKQFQKSVWIIPWECEDEILFVAEVFDVERYVEIIKADYLLHDKEARKAFNIS
jgi:DNA-binding PadR family transcriptional regulator